VRRVQQIVYSEGQSEETPEETPADAY